MSRTLLQYDYLYENMKEVGHCALVNLIESRTQCFGPRDAQRRAAGHLHIQVRVGTADGSGADKPSKASADNGDIAAVSCSSLPPRAIAVCLIPRDQQRMVLHQDIVYRRRTSLV